MQDTVLKWLAELGPALRVGLSFKLHSQFIVEKKYVGPWICGLLLVAPVAFPQYCPFHSASPETCHLLQLLVTPAPLLSESTAAQLPSLPGPRISIKTWSALAGRRKKAQRARVAFMKVFH